MTIRNSVPPHLVVKPCRKCHKATKALHLGQIQLHPTCQKCKIEEDKIFHLAQLAANRQSRNRVHRAQTSK